MHQAHGQSVQPVGILIINIVLIPTLMNAENYEHSTGKVYKLAP